MGVGPPVAPTRTGTTDQADQVGGDQVAADPAGGDPGEGDPDEGDPREGSPHRAAPGQATPGQATPGQDHPRSGLTSGHTHPDTVDPRPAWSGRAWPPSLQNPPTVVAQTAGRPMVLEALPSQLSQLQTTGGPSRELTRMPDSDQRRDLFHVKHGDAPTPANPTTSARNGPPTRATGTSSSDDPPGRLGARPSVGSPPWLPDRQ